jgi:hypothetical protein
MTQTPRLRTEGETSSSETTQDFSLVQQWRDGSGSRLRNRASMHRFDQSDRGCAWTIKENIGFLTLRNAQGILVEVELVVLFSAPYTLRLSGGMEEGEPSRLTSSVLFACIRVDTCHP